MLPSLRCHTSLRRYRFSQWESPPPRVLGAAPRDEGILTIHDIYVTIPAVAIRRRVASVMGRIHTHPGVTTVSTTLNWGILSTGAIAKAFALGVQQSKFGKLVAVGSRSKESADKFADQFQIPTRHASYEALLADPQVQAVYIATPHVLHAEWAVKAAAAGKAVLCEKPMALNQWEAASMQAAAAEHKTFLMEAFMYRCHPQTAKLVEVVKSGAIGQVKMIQATFSFHAGFNPQGRLYNNAMGGGGIMDVGCYAVSFARLIAGAAAGKPYLDPVSVVAAGHVGESNVDEYAAAVLKFPAPGNIVAQVATGVGLNQENVCRIYGSDGWIHVPNPWTADRQKGGTFTFTVHAKGKPAEQVTVETDRTAFSFESDVVAQAVAAGKQEPQSPAMTWGDTLGNLRTLDQWRSAVGLMYDAEKHEFHKPVYGRAIQRRAKVDMKYGRIPGLDKDVSRLIIGCDNQGTFAHAAAMFDDWFERGGNAFDTSFVYGGGRQEILLGQWIKSRNVRNDVVITVKGAHTPRCTPELMAEDFKTSLDRLQLTETDLYVMHRDNPNVPVQEFVDLMNDWRDKGLVKAFGGSNWSIARFEEANAYAAKAGKEPMRILNNNLSLAHMVKPVWNGCVHVSDKASRAWLEKTQTTVFSWSSQARGYFLGDEEWQKLGPGNFECWDSADNRKRRERAFEVAKKKGVLPINVALAYLMHQPFPVFALVGPRLPIETFTTLPGLHVTLTPDEVAYLAGDA